MSIRKALILLAPAAALLCGPAPTAASCAAPTGFTGIWKADDGGTYRVRAVANEVWWIGTSPDGGKSWTNVFRGVKSSTQLSGRWADISGPGGYGTLTLSIKGTTQLIRTASTGSPFGGTKWNRVVNCDDVGMNPV